MTLSRFNENDNVGVMLRPNLTDKYYFSDNGLGINTTDPQADLDVRGNVVIDNPSSVLNNEASFVVFGEQKYVSTGYSKGYSVPTIKVAHPTDVLQDINLGFDKSGNSMIWAGAELFTSKLGLGPIEIKNNNELPLKYNGWPLITAGETKIYNDYVLIGESGNSLGASPLYKLYVEKGIRTEEVMVDLKENWGDFVFAPEYELMSLDSVASYITENNHLPEIPGASDLESNGLKLGEMQRLQMIKIEELTLHLIEINEEKEVLENRLLKLETLLKELLVNQN